MNFSKDINLDLMVEALAYSEQNPEEVAARIQDEYVEFMRANYKKGMEQRREYIAAWNDYYRELLSYHKYRTNGYFLTVALENMIAANLRIAA